MNKKPNKHSEVLDNYAFSIEVELERLDYFNALFTVIKANPDSHLVKTLASLGQYLAQDFSYYSELDLEQLNKEQGGSDE